MHCQTSLNHTLQHLITVFGKSELSDRLEIPQRRINRIIKGNIGKAVFTDLCTIADKCGFETDNIIEEKIDPICAEKFLKGEKAIIPERFLTQAHSYSVTTHSILDSTPKYIREKAMRYLQLTYSGLNANGLVTVRLNTELLKYLQKQQAISYVIGQNTYFTYTDHPFSTAFKDLSVKDCYDKLINEVVKYVTKSSKFKLVKLNSEEAVFNSYLNQELDPESAHDLSTYELGFGSIIPVFSRGKIIEGKLTKSPFFGDDYSQYHFDFETAHPFFQYQ